MRSMLRSAKAGALTLMKRASSKASGARNGDAQAAAGRTIAAASELRRDFLLRVDIGLAGVEGDGAEGADPTRAPLSQTRQRLVESGFQLQIEGLRAFPPVVCRLHGCHGVSACFARFVERFGANVTQYNNLL